MSWHSPPSVSAPGAATRDARCLTRPCATRQPRRSRAALLGSVMLTSSTALRCVQAKRLIPLLDRVLVQRIEPPTKSIGGVLLPESTQSKLNEGVVIAVGPGKRDKDGGLLPMGVSINDKVLLPQYGGSEVTIENDDYVLFRDDDIMGILKD